MVGALVTTGLGLLGNAYGMYQSSKAGKEKRALNERTAKENEAWYKSEYYRDPTELTQNASYLRRIQNQYTDALKSSRNNAVKAGATPESQVAMGGALQSKYADAVNNLVSNATAYRTNVQRTYDYKKAQTDANKRQFLDEEQNSWSNFGANVAGASAGLLNAIGNGAFDSTTPKTSVAPTGTETGTTSTQSAELTPLQKLWKQDYQKTSFGQEAKSPSLGADEMLPEYVSKPEFSKPKHNPVPGIQTPNYQGGFSEDLTPDYLNQ